MTSPSWGSKAMVRDEKGMALVCPYYMYPHQVIGLGPDRTRFQISIRNSNPTKLQITELIYGYPNLGFWVREREIH